MGRKRTKDTWLPPRVYKGKSAYEFRPVAGGCVRLCSLDSPKSLVHKRYSEELAKAECKNGTFEDLALQYQDSDKFKALSPTTQKDYLKYHERLNKVFGGVHVGTIKPEHIRKYMDLRGRKSKTQANREKAYMSAVFKWGFQRGKAKKNPCTGVESFKETPRTRYITDDEYIAVYSKASTPIKIAMEIAYLYAVRKGDILKMTRSQLTKDGLYIKQGKTGKEQIKRLSARFREALRLSKGKVESIYLVHKKDGTRYTENGFNSAWRKAVKAAGLENAGFTFHDIKAKSISDYEGDKQKFSGHKTPRQVEDYDRKIPIVEGLNLPNIPDSENDK